MVKWLKIFLLGVSAAVLCAGQSIGQAPFNAPPTGRQVSPEPTNLETVLGLDQIIEIMRAEGIEYATKLHENLFPGQKAAGWPAQVEAIYAFDRLWARFHKNFVAAVAGRDMASVLTYFASPTGRRIVTLEVSARRAQLDDSIEAQSRDRLKQMRADHAPRLKLLTEFAIANDLIEMNVVGSLNSNFAFYRGLAKGGALPEGVTQDQMLGDVWTQEDAIRTETVEWLYPYLALAYQPLSDTELRSYIEFSRTKGGRAMNAALFAAFASMYDEISMELGMAAARYIAGDDI